MAAAERETRAQDAHGPLVPATRLPAVRAVRLAGAAETLARRVVPAADQMDLRERVEDGARRFVELHRTANVERAIQRLFRRAELSEAHANLPERRQRHRQAMARSPRFMDRDAALRQRERRLVAMLQHHHVRLIAADRREHVVGLHRCREALGLAERRERLVVAADLRERDAGERLHQREVPPVSPRVQRRRRLGDVLPDDRDVADLSIAEAQLVMRQADRAEIVRDLRVLERWCSAIARD